MYNSPLFYRFFLIFLLLLPVSSQAVLIEKILPNGVVAQAEYQQGDADKPAIFLLHGFMTVHTFSLIQNITDELAENGYTVLAPTLTLGIDKRKSTLDCDALHLHNMSNDIAEIDKWVNWLREQGHSRIILMGHSTGGLQLLNYLNKYNASNVSKLIAISLIPLGRKDQARLVDSINLARKLVDSKDKTIQKYTIAYCLDNYSSPPADYLSYASWDYKKILQAIKTTTLPVQVIMGGNDVPVYDGWHGDMVKAGAKVQVIEGANHFFSQGQEFELYESLLDKLDR